jgi:hypothetical protein
MLPLSDLDALNAGYVTRKRVANALINDDGT